MKVFLSSILLYCLTLSALIAKENSSSSYENSNSSHDKLFNRFDFQRLIAKSIVARLSKKYHLCVQGPPGPPGPQGPQGPQGTPGTDRPLTNTIFVDVGTTSTTQDGSISNPYSSIQTALNTVTPGLTEQDKFRTFTILVASGVYAEDLIINSNNNQIELVALGSVYLVKSAVGSPIVSSNVTINFLATSVPGPSANFGDMVSFTDLNSSLFSKNSEVGEIGQAGQFLITGTLNINDTSTAPTAPNLVSYRGALIGIPSNSSIQTLSINGLGSTSPTLSIDGTGSTRRHILNLDNAVVVASVNSPLSVLNARDSAFGNAGASPGLILDSYGLIYYSNITNGMSISELPRNVLANGVGIYSSNLAGVYTYTGPGPVSSPNLPWLLDGATNYWRKQSGATINPLEVEVLFDGTP